MIDVRVLQQLAKAIGAWRKTQRHLDCLTRQIAARAGRQAFTGPGARRVADQVLVFTIRSSLTISPSSGGSNST
ncbi:hypothetical protein [Agrobacterium tumefaciens]|uniref:hypothetical protein n=1 Tax=Agrobacterium tumefaciens TaxID=358 RepID=UPI001F1CF1A2|nr:hypothetical protein [Agrobacterium tumefaciens]